MASTTDPIMDARLDQFTQDLGALPPFTSTTGSDRLKAAILATERMKHIKSCFTNPDPNQTDTRIAGQDCRTYLEDLGVASTAVAIGNLVDSFKLHELAKKDEAAKQPNFSVQSMMSTLYADFIDRGFAQANKPQLSALKNDAAFVQAFKDFLDSPGTDPFTGRTDSPAYAQKLLYVYEYFCNGGPTFEMPKKINEIKSIQAMGKYQKVLASKAANATEDTLIQYAKHVGHVVSAIFNPTGEAKTSLEDFVAHLHDEGLLLKNATFGVDISQLAQAFAAKVKRRHVFDQINIEGYNAISADLHNIWATEIVNPEDSSFWRSGIRIAEKPVVEEKDNGGDPYHMHEITTYGPNLVLWAQANKDTKFVNSGVSLNNTQHRFISKKHKPAGGGGGSCFVPGTKVLLENGQINIQDLHEGAQVKTRASPEQYGTVSSEVVRSEAPEVVYGFNGEGGFVTAGHIFFTSTGLRAIDPHLAREENPWVEVGTLQVGHKLLRTTNGKDYEQFQIKSIEQHETVESYVYGVHLREGLRSYHANGFLVALNYPEITVASVARLLNQLPEHHRLQVVSSLDEIAPILQRFGGKTVIETLKKENHSNILSYGAKPRSETPLILRDLTMPYIAQEKESKRVLLRLELYSGVLHIDGKYCERASFEGGCLRWSRPIDEQAWEHGWCRFTLHGMRGRGRICQTVSQDHTVDEVKKSLQRFELVPGVIPPRHSDGAIHTAAVTATAAASTNPRDYWKFDISYDKSDFDPKKPVTTWKADQSFGSSTLKIVDGGADYSAFGFDQYDKIRKHIIEHCKSQTTDEKTKKSLESTPQFLNLYPTTDTKQRLVIKLEAVHCAHILQASDNFVEWKKKNPDWEKKQEEVPIRDLKFTGIGMPATFTLPLLFQSMQLTVNFNGKSAFGAITEYNPLREGSNGKAHWIAAKAGYPTTLNLFSAMSKVPVHTFSESRHVAGRHMHSHLSPLVTAIALDSSDLDNEADKTTAITSIVYDQHAINTKVQATMAQIVTFHMNEDDRTKLLQRDLPKVGYEDGNLDPKFAQLLDTETKEWITKTYAPAYLCQIFAAQNENVRQHLQFTDKEKASIQYFWSGQGANCLSRNKLYKTLERSITRHETRKTHSEISAAYNDKDASVGLKMSNLVFDDATNPGSIGTYGQEKNQSGTTRLTKLTAIMDALDAGAEQDRERTINDGSKKVTKIVSDTNANHLIYLVMAQQKFKGWDNPYKGNVDADGDTVAKKLEDEWLDDALKEIVEKILQNDAGYAGTVIAEMYKGLQKWGETLPGWDKMDPKDRILKVVSAMGSKLRAFMNGCSLLWGWTKEAGKWIFSKKAPVAWEQRSQRLARMAVIISEDASTDPPPDPKLPKIGSVLSKGLLFMVGVVALGAQLWMLSDTWATADVAKRGLLIMGVFSTVRQVADMGVDMLEAILRYKSTGALSATFENTLNRQFDELIASFARDDWSYCTINRSTYVWSNVGVKREFAHMAPEEETLYFMDHADHKLPGTDFYFVEDRVDDTFAELLEQWLKDKAKMVRIQRAFAVARVALQVIGYVIAIGVAIFMTWQLVHDWNTLDTANKAMQTIQVIFALVEAIGAAFILGTGAVAGAAYLVSAGLGVGAAFATSASTAFFAMASVFASVTAVLAVVAIIIMVAMFIYMFTRDPPLSPLETFIEQRGRPFASRAELVPPPTPCTFSISPSNFTSDENKVVSLKMTWKNETSSDVELSELTAQLASGKNLACMFNDGKKFTASTTPNTNNEAGIAYFETTSKTKDKIAYYAVNHQSDVANSMVNVSVSINGPDKRNEKTGDITTKFKIEAGASYSITLYGTVYAKEKKDGKDVQATFYQTQTKDEESFTNAVYVDRKAAS